MRMTPSEYAELREIIINLAHDCLGDVDYSYLRDKNLTHALCTVSDEIRTVLKVIERQIEGYD